MTTLPPIDIDVLCIGYACYDLIFTVDKHPDSDEKIFANNLFSSGGGPAANAAIAISKLGLNAAFSGYLGCDLYGEMHINELEDHRINTQYITRNSSPTPVSSVLVKPNGHRSLVNFKGQSDALPSGTFDFSSINAKSILLDGHQPNISIDAINQLKEKNIPIILDAGSLHEGTKMLLDKVDYLVCSEKFANQYTDNVQLTLNQLSKLSANVVITLGEQGIIWKQGDITGALPAYSAPIIDTNGAGDAFHGAFAAAIALNMSWEHVLSYASAAGTLCCTKIGARQGIPTKKQHYDFCGIS